MKYEYGKNFATSGMNVVSMPKNMVEGTIGSIGTVLNPDNFMEYLTTDDYDKIKEYTTAVAITGRVVNNTYKNVKAEIKNYQTNKIMNSVNISNINYNKLGEIGNNYSLLNSPNYSLLKISGSLAQYGMSSNIPKISLLRDNPYNGQTVTSNGNKTFAEQMSLEDANRYNQFWKQVEQGLTAEQRYNMHLYNKIDGSLGYSKIIETTAHKLDKTSDPNTIVRSIDKNGNIIRDRIYDQNGNVFRDIDFWHSGSTKDHFFPHVHQFYWENGNIVDRKVIK